MRLLILGGTAFLSAAVAREALSRGIDVSCLARGTTAEPPVGARWIRADRDSGAEAYPAGDWDAVVEVSWQPRQVRQALAALAQRTGHWTYVSTCSVYADNDVPGADESAPLLAAEVGDGPVSAERYGEAKVACEQATLAAVGDRLQISRPGLIAGAGDGSDRFGYWPARFARQPDERVLVPNDGRHTQVIGVHDLARWVVDAAANGTTGIFNAVGEPLPLPELLDRVQRVADHRGDQVRVDHDWLVEQQVGYWSGPESLPLWLPSGYQGFGARSNAAAKQAGLRLAPVDQLIAETLDDERRRGLGRRRRAGLSPEREAELLRLWDLR
ncbi:SDR family oxidoreductase [Microlunatus panaciterrae]|uniref:Nucleoside-diphosphate-sugar epimerase n=1 Tax=Microlunatus panaciterrae TaxID=400768 RepID=A0ABS2RN00_9ACTN|nr:oxidoreductase [Microlunatus panaciterrae]MBM7800376.1 nucleoside-diphosphate-sugar epimerase [Microlunatus panaciterrae]